MTPAPADPTSAAGSAGASPAGALAERLAELESRTPEGRIDLGLERVRAVFDELAPDLAGRRIVSVAGTNGKGSTVAFIESGLRAAGRSTLAYTSPHVVDFRERFRLDGAPAPAEDLVAALDRVERARGRIPLTYFEQITLAGFVLAERADVDTLILEVGLGGRLDAVNVVDADVAVITSIGLDHKEWLGSTRAAIGREKAGIARCGRPVVVAEPRPPAGLLDGLEALGAEVVAWGSGVAARWSRGRLSVRVGPPERATLRIAGLTPGISGHHQRTNAAAAVVVLDRLGLGEKAIRDGLASARARGRFERIADDPPTFVDVAHNPQAARALRDLLDARPGRKRAVFAALADKDVAGIARAIAPAIHRWYLAELEGPRALPIASLASRIRRGGVSGSRDAVESSPKSVAEALRQARADCRGTDEVIVFGSFLTASAAVRCCDS
ncbi:glutamate ligase domain-containing protein [Halomonas denitrificans]|nr:bifunctional folylpolyglutamate synthase/dihydrofolate synthase [Halomonas denitrificans]